MAYLIVELVRLMENDVNIFNNIYGLYNSKEGAVLKFNELKEKALKEMVGGDVDVDNDDKFGIFTESNAIELSLEQIGFETDKRMILLSDSEFPNSSIATVEVSNSLSNDDIESDISETKLLDSWTVSDIIESLGGRELTIDNFYI